MGAERLTVALETSSRAGGVSLGEGDEPLVTRAFDPGMRHARDLVPTLEELASERGLDLGQVKLAAVDIGPGSFTGLRVAVASVKALHLATRCRVTSVLAPDAVAAAHADCAQPLCVVIDATRGEVYATRYKAVEPGTGAPDSLVEGKAGVWRRVSGPLIISPADLMAELPAECVITGGGLRRYGEEFGEGGFALAPEDDWLPRPEWVYRLGRKRLNAGLTDDPYTLTPIYLRLPAAEERWRKLRGKDG